MTKPETGRKVGVVGPYPPLRGGIAHFSEQFHTQLDRDGVEVHGVSFSRQYPGVFFPGKSQYSDGATITVNAEAVLDSINPLSWTKAAERLVEKGVDDVVFMYWMPFFAPAYWRMSSILRKAGIGVSAIVHNAEPHKKQPFGKWLGRRFLSRCDTIIALSDRVKRDISALGITKKVSAKKHPVYSQFGSAPDKATARRTLGIDEQTPTLLFFGLVRRYKGLDILLKALPNTASKPFLIVAGEWYEDQSMLNELLDAAGLRDRILLVDNYIPDADVKLYFSACDVLVQPYRSATQSGVVQIAQHFGKPSIVTGVGGLPEMVQHSHDGLVVAPEDPTELAKAIDQFFSGDTAERLTREAATTTSDSSWESFTAHFIASLDAV